MIRIVEDDYIDFLFDYFNKELPFIKIVYPFKNPGLNMSISNFYNNKYLVSIRNIIPFTALMDQHKITPGISKNKKYNNLSENLKKIFNKNNFDKYTIFTWNNYESTIFFVCDLDIKNLKLIVDKSIKPSYFLKSFYSFPVPKKLKNLQNWQHFYPLEDFRIFFTNDKCYIYDSFVNQIHTVNLDKNKNKLVIKKRFEHICVNRFNNLESNNNKINKDYHKVYEKNWTLYKIIEENKKEKILKFIRDFEEDGLYGIEYYPEYNQNKYLCEKGFCKNIKLLSYNLNSIPINKNCDMCRFSIGSPAIEYKNDNYIGLGHIKLSFKNIIKNKNITNETRKDFNDYFYNKAKEIHFMLKKKYGKFYKPHTTYIYAFYIFIFNDKEKVFKMSDIFLPLPEYEYKFSLTFPMSIISEKDDFILSAGYGDFTNMLIKIEKDNLLDMVKYNISDKNFNVKNLKFKFVK